MPDACLVHLGPKRGRSEIVKDQGTGTRAGGKRDNPPPPGRRAGAGSEGRGSLVLLRHILHLYTWLRVGHIILSDPPDVISFYNYRDRSQFKILAVKNYPKKY